MVGRREAALQMNPAVHVNQKQRISRLDSSGIGTVLNDQPITVRE